MRDPGRLPHRADTASLLIRFGSRTDLYLPEGVRPLVVNGQTMIGGETVIADFNSAEAARTAESR